MSRAQGIDVSVWDGAVDFAKAKAAGASFAYVKASQQVADARFSANWKNSKGILPRGAYHYLDWRMSEILQAKLFCDLLVGDNGELPPVLDLEMDPVASGMSLTQVQGRAMNFLAAVEKATGKIPMIYTGYYYWGSYGNKVAGWAHYPLWLPWYASENIIKTPLPWAHWTFWQYTDRADGHLFGCESAGVDMSYFNGTVAELQAYCKICHSPGYLPDLWTSMAIIALLVFLLIVLLVDALIELIKWMRKR